MFLMLTPLDMAEEQQYYQIILKVYTLSLMFEVIVMNTNPFFGFVKALILFLTGRIHFYEDSKGRLIEMNGQYYTVFRHVCVTPFEKAENDPEAVFRVVFQPANMSIEENKRFSILPMLCLLGFKGFRSKYWCVDEKTGVCHGTYEWQTVEDAVNYSKSIAMRFMTRRSFPGSVHYEIIPQNKKINWIVEGSCHV